MPARSHLLVACVLWVGFSSSPHSIIYLTFWRSEHAPLPLHESASALAQAEMNQDGVCENQGETPWGWCRHAALDGDGWRGCSWENVDCFMIWDAEILH